MVKILVRFHYDSEEADQFREAVDNALRNDLVLGNAEFEIEIVDEEEA